MIKNIFKNIPNKLDDELVETIAASSNVNIERIVSMGQASPEGFWYDQDEDEFVILLQGCAGLRFEDGDNIVELIAGDYLTIRAHERHRVEWTSKEEQTIWLCVFVSNE